jgi:hypothetical protein
MYNVNDQYLIGQAKNEPEYIVMFSLNIDSAYFLHRLLANIISLQNKNEEAKIVYRGSK